MLNLRPGTFAGAGFSSEVDLMQRLFLVVAVFSLLASPVFADTFLDGTYVVGKDILPGMYQAPGGQNCAWQLQHKDWSSVIGDGRNPVVEILATDLTFLSTGCGMWKPAPETSKATLPTGWDAGLLTYGLTANRVLAIMETQYTGVGDIVIEMVLSVAEKSKLNAEGHKAIEFLVEDLQSRIADESDVR